MKSIAFVVGPALGHVSRTFLIAEQLATMIDCKVTFVSPSSGIHFANLVSARFESIAIPSLDEESFAAGLQMLSASRQFDLIAFDLNPVRWLQNYRRPAEPCAYITNVFLTRVAGLQTTQIKKLKKQASGNSSAAGKFSNDTSSVYDLYELDRVLLVDPVPLAERYAPLPEHYKACGAVSWSPEDELPDALQAAHDVLLISMGSTGRKPIPVSVVNELVAATECHQVVVVGTKFDAIEGCSVPLHTYSQLSIRRLLSKTKLVLSSGGAGSTYLALEAGIPTVVWPTHRNQEILGEIIEDMGLGLLAKEEKELGRSLAASFPQLATTARNFAPAASSRAGAAAAAAELRAMIE